MHSGPTSDIEGHEHLGRLPTGIHYDHPKTSPRKSRSKVKTKKRKPEHKIDRLFGSGSGKYRSLNL